MCLGVSEFDSDSPFNSPLFRRASKRSKITVHSLTRWRRRSSREVVMMRTEMELKNLKLYLENRSMIEENAKLRKKAVMLHHENQILMLQLQKNKNNSNI